MAATATSDSLLASSGGDDLPVTTSKKRSTRLVALDIVRGFTVSVMILVDDTGDAYQMIDHAPWDGLTFADIVMPWFLFMVGTAMAFSLKRVEATNGRRAALRKITVRTVKLFLLGLALQGGGMPDPSSGTWGWNLSHIRWCGILQRIAFAYFVVGVTKTYVPARPSSSSASPLVDLLRMHALQWLVPAFFASLYLLLMLLTPVPSWDVANTSISRKHGIAGKTIACNGTRGDLGPACSAAGYYDRLLFGQSHLYQPGEKVRLPECSSCSPGYCQPNATQPTWCWAPFDPEGSVATLMTILTTYLGVHFGHAIHRSNAPDVQKPSSALLWMWGVTVGVCAAFGLALLPVLPSNKQLWTPSYALLNAAMCGGALVLVYAACDVAKSRVANTLLRPFQWMGMNALFVFVMAASDVFETILDAFFVGTPGNNFTSWLHTALFNPLFRGATRWDPHGFAQMMYVLTKIAFWLAVSGLLHKRRWYWKF
jgi:heparan-alpha-glucosaminide N-acetyltransferase